MHRRAFLQNVAGTLAAGAVGRIRAQQPGMPSTYTYKTAAGCAIQADVYGGDGSSGKPALLWIHGGALIWGSRKSLSHQFRDALVALGFVVVSIDYRLAPETKLQAIVEDVQDACGWVRRAGAELFHIDPSRVAVAGGSAGGYLTLMTGFSVNPRPRALVSFWGYGDLEAPCYTRPDRYYSQQPAVPKEEAYQAVGTSAISEPPETNQRWRFYAYCRQHGIWAREVAGHDPEAELAWFDRYCPIRHVTAQYPPTMLIHGSADTDVPYQESRKMSDKLGQAGVKHELVTVEGAGHGLSGARPEEIAHATENAVGFIRTHTT